jgi:hypothetical protein
MTAPHWSPTRRTADFDRARVSGTTWAREPEHLCIEGSAGEAVLPTPPLRDVKLASSLHADGSDSKGFPPEAQQAPRPRLRILTFDQTEDDPGDQPDSSIDASQDEFELLERRKLLVSGREKALNERLHELEQWEAELEKRQVELDQLESERRIAIELEQEILAARQQEAEDLAARLALKERQVADYVAQAQKQLAQITPATTVAHQDSSHRWLRRTRANRT